MTQTANPAASSNGATTGSIVMLAALVATIALLGFVFADGIMKMVGEWEREEYSHSYLIPVIAMFLAWQNRRALTEFEWRGSWLAVPLLFLAMLLFFVGELSSLFIIIQYALLGTIATLCLAMVGWRGMRWLWVPLVYLIFMIPLPNFLYQNLSQELQLISSQLGVLVIRAFGISVYLEGNVIDLGVYKLQVVEACSGLRYLFPLMSFGFLCAYLYRGAFWQRAIIFLSSIPLTVLMNSIRIGVIGVMVEHLGIGAAEGFLHYFEGWIIFMTCVLFLFLEMWLFARFRKDRRTLREVFSLEYGEPAASGILNRPVPSSYWVALAVLTITGLATVFVDQREENVPERPSLASFPLSFGEWSGADLGMEQQYINILKFDDYLLANFNNRNDAVGVNLYVAWYDSQRKGAAIHSPRSCIPGDGWEIEEHNVRDIDGVRPDGQKLPVNRVVIRKGQFYQLVYYWFDQRGRILTNEYAVKWYLLEDAITRQRTDGALVRLTTGIGEGEDLAKADARLVDFARDAYPKLTDYLPD